MHAQLCSQLLRSLLGRVLQLHRTALLLGAYQLALQRALLHMHQALRSLPATAAQACVRPGPPPYPPCAAARRAVHAQYAHTVPPALPRRRQRLCPELSEPAGFLEREIASTQAAGQLFVVASGNSGVDLDAVPLYPTSYKTDNMISVASSGANDYVSTFSNLGV